MTTRSSRKRTRSKIRVRNNKPSLEATIMEAILSFFTYSVLGDKVLATPDKIRQALRILAEDERLWTAMETMAYACNEIKEAKNAY